MKILSTLTGELTLLDNLLPSIVSHIESYAISNNVGTYNVYRLYYSNLSAYFIDATANHNDTVTLIQDKAGIYIQLSLTNSFNSKVSGLNELLVHENSLTLFYVPALYAQWEIKKQTKVVLIHLPETFLQLVTGNYSLLSKFLQLIHANKPGKLSKNPVIADKSILQTIDRIHESQEQTTFQNLCIDLLIATIQKTENDKNKNHIQVSLKDADKIYKVKDYIDKNYKKKITLTIIADKTKVSQHTIKVYFKAIYNKSYHDYLNEKKIDYSLSLLQQGFKIADIAKAICLDTKTFNKLFLQHYHISAKQYQKQNGNFR